MYVLRFQILIRMILEITQITPKLGYIVMVIFFSFLDPYLSFVDEVCGTQRSHHVWPCI